MILDLDENYRIITDKTNQNFILQYFEEKIDVKTKELTGERDWKDKGYYGGQIKWALNKYLTLKIMYQNEVDVKRLISKIEEVEKTILRVVKRENIKLEEAKE